MPPIPAETARHTRHGAGRGPTHPEALPHHAGYSLAEQAVIPTPKNALPLARLTSSDLVEDKVSTCPGVESVRVVCCFVDADSYRWLDRTRRHPLPEKGSRRDGSFTTNDVRAILAHSIPVADGDWRRPPSLT
ncbi:hypothetical protein CcI6DRAFT_04395 [Frankia sp. CcI6]|uniref:hypothetical protein n=1 Tax=Frankia TaxID=1854 RepID=UPI0003CFC467|nr:MULTISPECIES: hypothetical protein [Frankia]ETA00204.1 hypothetical protein CcI6DRAFT_04395 [Frankia sp. CcI6]KFB02891.1 hypothetical protein ALLO2DRAFT_04372 [Frankia sp. Allo2]OAA18895.1 hypothetical protein AAY23_111418 [Frankia casuarinae]